MSDDSSGVLPMFDVPRSPLHGMLAKAGWVRRGGVEDRYELWSERETDTDFGSGILVPLDRTKEDYPILYERALNQFRQRLSEHGFKVLEVRQRIETDGDLAPTTWKRGSPTPPGTIPWTRGGGATRCDHSPTELYRACCCRTDAAAWQV